MDITRKRKIFDIYTQNWFQITQHPKIKISKEFERSDLFVCPLCFDGFTVEELENKNITIEHVPPSSLGGKSVTLTCKSCNNAHGSSLEAPLHREISNLSFAFEITGATKNMRATFNTLSNSIGMNVTIDEDRKYVMLPVAKQSDSRVMQQMHDIFMNAKLDTVNLQYKTESRTAIHGAFLRIAYLLAFRQLGYGFLINQNLVPVREQLKDHGRKVIPTTGIFIDFPWTDEFLGINIVKKPDELKSYLIVFDLKDKNTQAQFRCGMLLPRHFSPGINVYNYLVNNVGNNIELQISPMKDFDNHKQPYIATQHKW